MKINLWWRTYGIGYYHLVLLHGWGLNAKVWNYIVEPLSTNFVVHLVDLPGFGRSIKCSNSIITLCEISEQILKQSPYKAIWLGWSFGGLIASWIALTYPERVQALITVASSPCFIARNYWPGISLEILTKFQYQLNCDRYRVIKDFIIVQTMSTNTAWRDALILKKILLELPIAKIETLNSGLEILKATDMREQITTLIQPHLRIYGSCDKLIPYKIISLLDNLWPDSQSYIITGAAHVPFISHPNIFCKLIIDFSIQLD